MERPISADLLFKAFSDATRLRILSLLRKGELCVGDLVGVLDAPQPKVSRHLAYLRRAGLVESREEGPWAYYRLARPASAFHRKLLDCLVACFAEVPKVARDAKRARALRGSGCCPATGCGR
jgi:ArsR family transcriptional regulator